MPDYEAGNVRIVQLTTYGQLMNEGQALHHCVATYLSSCRLGRCAIFSLTAAGRHSLTLEVEANRTVVQVRGKHNRWMTDAEEICIKLWLDQARLVMSKYA